MDVLGHVKLVDSIAGSSCADSAVVRDVEWAIAVGVTPHGGCIDHLLLGASRCEVIIGGGVPSTLNALHWQDSICHML